MQRAIDASIEHYISGQNETEYCKIIEGFNQTCFFTEQDILKVEEGRGGEIVEFGPFQRYALLV